MIIEEKFQLKQQTFLIKCLSSVLLGKYNFNLITTEDEEAAIHAKLVHFNIRILTRC